MNTRPDIAVSPSAAAARPFARAAARARGLDRRAGMIGFLGSLGLHLAALAAIALRWPQGEPPIPAESEPVTVEFVVEKAEPPPKPEDTRARPAAPRAADASGLAVEAESQPGRVPVPEAKPAPPRAAPAEPRLTAVPRAKPKPPTRFDPARVAALLDKAQKETSPSSAPSGDDAAANSSEDAAQRMQDRLATASLAAALAARVARCWTPPVGAKGMEKMTVRIEIRLAKNGRLVGMPQLLGVSQAALARDPYYRAFVESARRAVLACAPYDDLPAPLYRLWRQIEFTFSPRNMY